MSKVKQWAENTAEKKVDDIIYKLKDGQISFGLIYYSLLCQSLLNIVLINT